MKGSRKELRPELIKKLDVAIETKLRLQYENDALKQHVATGRLHHEDVVRSVQRDQHQAHQSVSLLGQQLLAFTRLDLLF